MEKEDPLARERTTRALWGIASSGAWQTNTRSFARVPLSWMMSDVLIDNVLKGVHSDTSSSFEFESYLL